MKVYCLYGLLIFLLLSCQDSEEKKISRLVQEWEGKEIFFPEECSFSDINGNPCAAPALDAPFKIVYYVDSLGCMSCKLKLEEWNEFLKEVDSLSVGKVSPFFYFHPKKRDVKELGFMLRSRSFDYPVCIDTLDSFNAANQFPVNDSFHTFLLDSSNRIVLMGNPVLNPTVKDLYMQVITGKESADSDMEQTQVSLSVDLLDLGVLEPNKPVSRAITIRNMGENPLVINDVITSCDCVKASASASMVQPGKTAEIQIEFKPDELGEFYKDVYIFCNTAGSPVGIQIHGNVKE